LTVSDPLRAAGQALAPPDTIAPYIREIGRGKEGARSLRFEQAFDLMSRLLDGRLSDIELGGFALAMRVKGESAAELVGFVAAAQQRLAPLPPADRAVLLPSYNGARKQPNLTPLLAALLAARGVPVLVHGPVVDPGRVTSAAIFEAMGLPPCADAAAVRERWQAKQPAFIAIDVLCPPLARLLAIRRVLGLRNSGHTMAKILPALPGALRVVNHTHPEYAESLGQFLADTAADAVLMRGTEGEPVADARRAPAMAVFVGGRLLDELSTAQADGPLTQLPELPAAIDAGSTAAHIAAVLEGRLAAPRPIVDQVDLLLRVRERLLPPAAGESAQ
jgi:anthranilate phosphoribosyltransferase